MANSIQKFISEHEIWSMLEAQNDVPRQRLDDILEKARAAQGLEPAEAAALLLSQEPAIQEEMFRLAREIKETIYGRRLVLFAPLYISNYCVNDCRYCGYQRSNGEMPRRKLSQPEIAAETRALLRMGHKRIALETGEDPRHSPIEYVLEAMRTIYEVEEGKNQIRRINVNIAATTVENYRALKQAGIGTYILFQETYHPSSYRLMHPIGPKSDFLWHLEAMDRAIAGGIDDVGIGVLFGLFDYRFEVMGLLLHARHLEQAHGVGPHTISVPRLRPADQVSLERFPYLVSDEAFRRLIAVLRMAVPYTGIILSTRERPGYRDELLSLGISQLSTGSCTGVGGYQSPANEPADQSTCQFGVEDHRSPEEMIRNLCENGYLPSFCTACYRSGRTGDRFMSLAKTGRIGDVCLPNALLTFKEYLLDYAGPDLRQLGEKAIQLNLQQIQNQPIRTATAERLSLLEAGVRDLYF